MASKSLTTHLEENPRMIGALFTVLLILSQTGSVMGSALSTTPGP